MVFTFFLIYLFRSVGNIKFCLFAPYSFKTLKKHRKSRVPPESTAGDFSEREFLWRFFTFPRSGCKDLLPLRA